MARWRITLKGNSEKRHHYIRSFSITLVIIVFVGLDILESLGPFKHTSVTRESEIKAQKLDTQLHAENSVANGVDIGNGDRSLTGSLDHSSVESESESAVDNVENGNVVWRGASWKSIVGAWLQKNEHLPEIPVTERFFNRPCKFGCRGRGVCNHEQGRCRCQLGYGGSSCSGDEFHRCNIVPFPPSDSSPSPVQWIVSACPTVCDNRTARCTCGPRGKYPSRPILDPCSFEGTPDGIIFSPKVEDLLFSSSPEAIGWCQADPRQVELGQQNLTRFCPCTVDGTIGELCDKLNLAYCFSGCSNNGICTANHCKCNPGWYGMDCSIPSLKVVPRLFPEDQGVTQQSTLPPWLGVPWSPVKTAKEGNSVRNVRNFMRKRPLIYVYDLPTQFTSQILEGRKNLRYCVPWRYDLENHTDFYNDNLYAMEGGVVEALLSSPHRTTNAIEADFFFVPLLTGCIVVRGDDNPEFQAQYGRPYLTTVYARKVLQYIRYNYPFWNNSHGKDHLWIYPWDEGACYAPQEIWNSTMITSWGNTGTKYNKSTTAYLADNWELIPKSIRGDHPCFDPNKDIVMPAWKTPIMGLMKKWKSNSPENRKKLFYFNGKLGPNFEESRIEESYSMGIRQKVAKYFASEKNKEGKLGELFEEGVVVEDKKSGKSYSEQLFSSVFCGVFPGDGFSARLEDSLLHGCIPVIIQDGIQMPFENHLKFEEFSVRIQEDDIPNLVKILKGVEKEKIAKMQAVIHDSWQRWTYSSVMKLEASRQFQLHGVKDWWAHDMEEMVGDDAIATFFQILNYKLHNDPWRKDLKTSK